MTPKVARYREHARAAAWDAHQSPAGVGRLLVCNKLGEAHGFEGHHTGGRTRHQLLPLQVMQRLLLVLE